MMEDIRWADPDGIIWTTKAEALAPLPDISEPWMPMPGTRVTITLNGECEFVGIDSSFGPTLDREPHGGPNCNGKIGTVVSIEEGARYLARGHRFLVIWDVPEHDRLGRIDGDFYAACELMPLDGSS